MLNKVNQFSGINSYALDDESMCLLTMDNKLILENKQEKRNIDTSYLGTVIKIKGLYIYQSYEGEVRVFNSINFKEYFHDKDNAFAMGLAKDDDPVIFIRKNDFCFEIQLIENEKFVSNKIEGLWTHKFNDFYFYWNFNKIEYFNSIEKDKKVKLDLGNYPQIQSLLGVKQNILWLCISDETFLGLDITTGKVVKHYKPKEEVKVEGRPWIEQPFFDKVENKFYTFMGDAYFEIDLNSFTTTQLWQEDGIRNVGSLFTKDYIYYIGSPKGSVFSNRLGVFNRKTLKVEDEVTINLKKYGTLWTPKVSGNRVCVFEANSYVLHVYEHII